MKQLDNFIQEKLKLNKDIKVYSEIETKIGNKTIFSKDQINEIKELCNDLPIVPDILSNYNGINGSSNSYGSSFITLIYRRKVEWKGQVAITYAHDNNAIRIKYDKDSSQYFVRFIKIDEKDTYFYPEEQDKYFKSIKECFDCIQKEWKKLNFSKSIKEYK